LISKLIIPENPEDFNWDMSRATLLGDVEKALRGLLKSLSFEEELSQIRADFDNQTDTV